MKKKIRADRIDRKALSVSPSFDDPDYDRYWHSRTPQERVQHIEVLRRINYGSLAIERMKRVLEIVERGNAAD